MRLREPSVSVRLRDGTVSERPLRQLTAGQVVTAGPWRAARSARGQAHYPGYYWSATSGGHVIYESRLELDRLLLADFEGTPLRARLGTDAAAIAPGATVWLSVLNTHTCFYRDEELIR